MLFVLFVIYFDLLFLQEFSVNKNAPRHISGTPFEFHWFSEVCTPNIKEEKTEESEIEPQSSKEEAENTQLDQSQQRNSLAKDTAIQKAAIIEKWISTQQPGTPSSLGSNSTFTYENRSGDHLKAKAALPDVLRQSSVSTCTEETNAKDVSDLPVKPIVRSESSSGNSTFIYESQGRKHLKPTGKLPLLLPSKESSSMSISTEESAVEETSQLAVKPIVRSGRSFSSSTFTCENRNANHLEARSKVPDAYLQKMSVSSSTRTEEHTTEETSQSPLKTVVGPESSFKVESSSSHQTKAEAEPRTLRSGTTSSLGNQRENSDTNDNVKNRKRKTSSSASVANGSKMRRVSDSSEPEPSFKLQLSLLSLTKRQSSAKSSRSKEAEKKKKPITVESLLVNKTILPNLVETLKGQASELMEKRQTRNYAKKLNDCMTRVLRSRAKLTPTEPTTERVKRTTKTVNPIQK